MEWGRAGAQVPPLREGPASEPRSLRVSECLRLRELCLFVSASLKSPVSVRLSRGLFSLWRAPLFTAFPVSVSVALSLTLYLLFVSLSLSLSCRPPPPPQ